MATRQSNLPGGVTVALALVCAAALSLSAESRAPQDAPANPTPPGMVTYTGCVEASQTKKNTFTMSDGDLGTVYVLKGMNVRDFVGKRVEVTAKAPSKFVVKGGLYPNPNVAAQAGAMDPARAAVETMQTGPYGNEQRPTVDVQVRSARIVPGDCPAK